MGLWGKIKHAAHKAAKAVSKATKTVVNTVTEVASDAVESAGNAVASGFNQLGDWGAGVPGIGGALQATGHYIGNIVGAAADLAATSIKVGGALAGATIAGGFEIGFGILTFDGSLIKDGFLGIVSGVVSGIVLLVLKGVALVQSFIPGLGGRRSLTDAEKAMLKKVYRDSVALANVRVVEGVLAAGLLGLGDPDRAYTVGNTIYFKAIKVADEPWSLVHEIAHVWQYQNAGATYMGDAIGAQLFVPDEYNWERELQRGKTDWLEFNREAQAELIEDIWRYGGLMVLSPPPATKPSAPGGTGKPHGVGGTYNPIIGSGSAMGTATATPAAAAPSAAPKVLVGNGLFYDADNITTVGVFPADMDVYPTLGQYTAFANRSVATLRAPVSARPSLGWS